MIQPLTANFVLTNGQIFVLFFLSKETKYELNNIAVFKLAFKLNCSLCAVNLQLAVYVLT